MVADASLGEVHTVQPNETIAELYVRMPEQGGARRQRLFPVLSDGVLPVVDSANPGRLRGLITQCDLLRAHERVLVEDRHRERPLRLLTRAASRE
ncbi:MAG TPA: CBS domain-containing protein [Frankiaceae bacterium]|nr:CBS domain-containing protein [Frankiaceae bacterium]